MDGLEPLVLSRQKDGGYKVVELEKGQVAKAKPGGGWNLDPHPGRGRGEIQSGCGATLDLSITSG